MQKLRARKSFRYASRQLEVGDTFEAIERDGRMLVLLGKAEVPKAEAAEEPAPAEPEKPAEPEPAVRSPRAYEPRRR